MKQRKNVYMYFGGRLGIQKGLHSVPQQPKARTSIDDKHLAESLCHRKKIQKLQFKYKTMENFKLM